MSSQSRDLITEERALELLLAAQAAWNARDLRALLDLYTEDFTYWTNWGGPDNGPRTVTGRQEFIRHLADVRDTSDIKIRLTSFRMENGQGRASFEVVWRDLQTELRHTFTCREIVTFANDRITRIDEFHDASALQAFTALIARHAD